MRNAILFILGLFSNWVWGANEWINEIEKAYLSAQSERKMLFVEFVEPGKEPISPNLGLPDAANHVFTTADASGAWRKEEAFNSLQTPAGIAILDFTAKENAPIYALAVSVLPGRKMNKPNVTALLSLPSGTLTQRSMIWAIRTHHQKPKGTQGVAKENLMNHSQRWALTMANWSQTTRPPSWAGRSLNLPAMEHNMQHPGATEILTTTWLGKSSEVTDAATALIHSWYNTYGGRNEGHWGVVLKSWRGYGYDMAYDPIHRIWYACGVAE